MDWLKTLWKTSIFWWVLSALVTGFVAGMLLQGPTAGDSDWRRSLDYGNVPQWVALIVGAAVAAFTIRGILIAQKAYGDDVKVREFAQARLIYAEMVKTQYIRSEDTGEHEIRVKKMLPEIFYGALAPGEDFAAILHNPNEIPGFGYSVSARSEIGESGRMTVVRVNNDSNEIISAIQIEAWLCAGEPAFKVLPVESRVVLPNDFVEVVILTSGLDHLADRVRVTFTDSMGLVWSRDSVEPVRRVE